MQITIDATKFSFAVVQIDREVGEIDYLVVLLLNFLLSLTESEKRAATIQINMYSRITTIQVVAAPYQRFF
ncbi:hypothetical protein P3L10_005411 [Capsicum annuum]